MTQHDSDAYADMALPNLNDLYRVTVEEAAKILGVSVDAIRKRIERGTLESEKVGGTRYVLLDGVSAVGHDANMSSQGSDLIERTAGQDSDQIRHDKDMTDLLASMQDQIDTLKQELEDRKEEARRKDAILLTLAQRVPELEAAPEPREPRETASEANSGEVSHDQERPQEPRSWWRRFFGIE